MIKLTRLNASEVYLNPDLIKLIEERPDTIITLANDDHYLVREKAVEIVELIIAYRVRLLREAATVPPVRLQPEDAD